MSLQKIKVELKNAETTKPLINNESVLGIIQSEDGGFKMYVTHLGPVRKPGGAIGKFPQSYSIGGDITTEDMRALKTFFNNLNL